MRGAAMSLTAALSGFVVFLLSGSVVQGQRWAVTYSRTQICAVKGSTVEISCTFTYPSSIYYQVQRSLWFSKGDDYSPVDLKTDSDYRDRVHYNCDQSFCRLMIRDLRESDSAEYKFRFITNHPDGRFIGSPGVTLSVTALQVQVIRSTHIQDYYQADLECQSSCQPDQHSYIWIKNEKKTLEQTSASISASVYPADRYSCALKGYEEFPSPPVYVPKLPSVSVSPSGEIVEGSSVTLTCSSDANPPATYTWNKYKGGYNPVALTSQLVFRSISSSDSGQYYCGAENKLGWKMSESNHIDVKYAPNLPSVSVSPSGEIVEGSSVTLTCSSYANPAATYTWYKDDVKLPHKDSQLVFSSISSSDSGHYYCEAKNKLGQKSSESKRIDVKYAPKLPSVSVSPSGEIVEGSSVTLTCSSDANPAATYTWYKEDEESPKASGPIFTITDVRVEHSGNYSCEAQNTRGSQNSTVHLIVVRGSSVRIMNIIRLTLVVLMLIPLLVLSLWMRKKKSFSSQTGPHEAVEMIQLDSDPDYQNISG